MRRHKQQETLDSAYAIASQYDGNLTVKGEPADGTDTDD